MKFKHLLPLLLLSISCQKKLEKEIDSSPFSSVVKYISAESFADTIEAKKYINIAKTFTKYVDKENPTAYKVWENQILFNNNLSEDKKYTNHFKFYNYNIKEAINGKNAKVTFTSKNSRAKIKAIEYSLELINGTKWSIINIEYKK
jgi:hypothetical protein